MVLFRLFCENKVNALFVPASSTINMCVHVLELLDFSISNISWEFFGKNTQYWDSANAPVDLYGINPLWLCLSAGVGGGGGENGSTDHYVNITSSLQAACLSLIPSDSEVSLSITPRFLPE